MNQQLERQYLVHVLHSVDNCLVSVKKGVHPEFFQWSISGLLYKLVTWYVATYNAPLTSAEIVPLLKQSTSTTEEIQKAIVVLFEELMLENIDSNIDFLTDEFFKYHKQNLTEKAIHKATEYLSEGAVDKSLEALKNDLAKIDQKFRVETSRSGQLDQFAPRIKAEHFDRKQNPQKYEGVKIGFADFDRITGGLVSTSVSILIGPPKGFKSALAMNIASNVAKQYENNYIYYHANEGTIELFYMRYAAMELGIPLSKIKDGKMTQDEEQRWLTFMDIVEQGKHPILRNIYFDEVHGANSSPTFIAQRIKKLQEEDGKKLKLVIVDHFGRMKTADKAPMQDWQEKGVIAQEICALALQERVPFILLSHAKASSTKEAREEGKDFEPEDLERSGQPIKDVDYFISWVIENQEEFDREKKGFARLALKLSRHSETGSASLHIDGKVMRIAEITVGGVSSFSAPPVTSSPVPSSF